MAQPAAQDAVPIGELGEDFVEWLCQRPFAKDFLFRGQHYRTKDGDVELCDLLMLMEDTAILFEVKTAKRDLKQAWSDEEWAVWAGKRMSKAVAQLERGTGALLGGLVQAVNNDRQGTVQIEPGRIRHVYGVTVVDHPPLDKWGRTPTIEVAGRTVSVLTTTHEELGHLITELSTPSDFIEYLVVRKAFFEKNRLFGISELDLLACFKDDPEHFAAEIAAKDLLVIQEGCWTTFSKLEGRTRRDQLDRPSYIVDAILDKLHEARHAVLPHIENRRGVVGNASGGERYIDVAVELARKRRIDRRVIGERLLDKSNKCNEQGRDRWFCVSPTSLSGIPIVFLVSTQGREERMKSLEMVTLGAKLRTRARRVLGIATEPVIGGHGFSVDAFMIDQDPSVDATLFTDEIRRALLEQFGEGRQATGSEFGGPD